MERCQIIKREAAAASRPAAPKLNINLRLAFFSLFFFCANEVAKSIDGPPVHSNSTMKEMKQVFLSSSGGGVYSWCMGEFLRLDELYITHQPMQIVHGRGLRALPALFMSKYRLILIHFSVQSLVEVELDNVRMAAGARLLSFISFFHILKLPLILEPTSPAPYVCWFQHISDNAVAAERRRAWERSLFLPRRLIIQGIHLKHGFKFHLFVL